MFGKKKDAEEHPALRWRKIEEVLERLGYTFYYQKDGKAVIAIADYADRPVIDAYRLVYLTQPIGYASAARTENPAFYSFTTPVGTKLGEFSGEDILDDLLRFETYVREYISQNKLPDKPDVVAPYMHLTKCNLVQMNEVISLNLPPKWYGDVRSFGFSHEEVVGLADVPLRDVYGLFVPENAK